MLSYDEDMSQVGGSTSEGGCHEAAVLRESRARLVHLATRGDVTGILATDGSDPAAQCYVVKLLDVMPGLGKVAGRRLLTGLGLSPFVRLADLDASLRGRLRDALGGVHG